MLKSTMSDNRILQPSAITIVPSVADIFLTLPKTSIIAPPSICSLFGRVYAISTCHSLDEIKIKNSAINEWIAGHNIVRIALYCKRKLSFFIFLHHPSHEVLWMTGHTERKRSASYRNEMACRGVMK